MKIVYMGTPDFSVLPLRKIAQRKSDEIIAVITNPDKPVGRKRILTACPVKAAAQEMGYKVLSYDKIRESGVEDLKSLSPDLIVTCAFGQILSKEILDIPKFGVINVHASLLPKYRGASPIHYAILNGEKVTGVTIMKTDVGIDTGDVLISKEVKIGEDETCGELFGKLSAVGAELLDNALDLIESGKAVFLPQNGEKATFTKMIKKEDALINWAKPAFSVKNQVRAFNPAPVAYTYYKGEQIKIFEVEISGYNGEAGEIICDKNRLTVCCGKGSVDVKYLQKAGGKRLAVADFLRGNAVAFGDKFGNA